MAKAARDIIAVVAGLTPKIIRYVGDIKHEGVDRQSLVTEIITTGGILAMVKVVCDDPDQTRTGRW